MEELDIDTRLRKLQIKESKSIGSYKSIWNMFLTLIKFVFVRYSKFSGDRSPDQEEWDREFLLMLIENPKVDDTNIGSEIRSYVIKTDITVRRLRTQELIEKAFEIRPNLLIPSIPLEFKPETQPD